MTDKRKITNISEARRQANAPKTDKKAGATANSASERYQKALLRQRGVRGLAGAGSTNIRWYHYLQLLLLLALVALLMRACTGG